MKIFDSTITSDVLNISNAAGSDTTELEMVGGNLNVTTFRIANVAGGAGNFYMNGGNTLITSVQFGNNGVGFAQFTGGNFTVNDMRIGNNSQA